MLWLLVHEEYVGRAFHAAGLIIPPRGGSWGKPRSTLCLWPVCFTDNVLVLCEISQWLAMM